MAEIRSFRRVFDLERRIYRIDSIRLNPSGVPVRGVLYLLGAVAAAQLAAAMPVIGRVVTLLPWYVRSVGLPLATALVLGVIRVEGRHFHLAALALARFVIERRNERRAVAPPRWRPSDVTFLPDGSDATLRRLRYRGPGIAVIRVTHRREPRVARSAVGQAFRRRQDLVLTESRGGPARPLAIVVGRGGRIVTRHGDRTGSR